MLGTPLGGTVDYPLWLPPLAALAVSFFSSMVGISGAFLLLPLQISVLGHAGPAASATNLVYNLVATPSGVWRYGRDGRLAWPLVWVMVLGTLPGVVAGFYLRVLVLPDPARFKPFVGAVLLLLAWRLLWELTPWGRRRGRPWFGTGPLKRLRPMRPASCFALGMRPWVCPPRPCWHWRLWSA